MKIGRLYIQKQILVGISILGLAIISILVINTAFAQSDGEPANSFGTEKASTETIPDLSVQTQTASTTLVKMRLYDVGILPRQAIVPAGNVNFAVEDFYGSECKLVIEQEVADHNNPLQKIGKIKDDQITGRLRKIAGFAPGRYWISMEDKPENRMLLIVENRQ